MAHWKRRKKRLGHRQGLASPYKKTTLKNVTWNKVCFISTPVWHFSGPVNDGPDVRAIQSTIRMHRSTFMVPAHVISCVSLNVLYAYMRPQTQQMAIVAEIERKKRLWHHSHLESKFCCLSILSKNGCRVDGIWVCNPLMTWTVFCCTQKSHTGLKTNGLKL